MAYKKNHTGERGDAAVTGILLASYKKKNIRKISVKVQTMYTTAQTSAVRSRDGTFVETHSQGA